MTLELYPRFCFTWHDPTLEVNVLVKDHDSQLKTRSKKLGQVVPEEASAQAVDEEDPYEGYDEPGWSAEKLGAKLGSVQIFLGS